MAKRVTLKEVAAHAGVSYQTVSKVLNHQIRISEDTEERIWSSVKKLGYRPNLIARSLRSQHSHLIGYSWEPTPPCDVNPILDQFLQSMVQVAESAGYYLLAFPFRTGEQWIDSYRDLIDTNRVDAFVVSSIDYEDLRLRFLLERKFPFVAFGRSNPDWTFPYVDVDGAEGMRMVIEHLVKQGHRRFGLLCWPASSRVGNNRMDGVKQALEEAGLSLTDQWIGRGEGNFEYGYQTVCPWLDLPAKKRPTAIVAFNDSMAIGAMRAAQDHGLQVGQQLAVTGFDDSPVAQYLTPSLTSVRQPILDVGERVVSLLLGILKGRTPEDHQILVKPSLITRDSSKFHYRE